MIIYMCRVVCITNKELCQEDFLKRIEAICASGVTDLILREKNLTQESYEELAKQVIPICNKYQVTCILHHFYKVAMSLKHYNLHMPLKELQLVKNIEDYKILGASCHSLEDAVFAQKMGCSYITMSHIFETDCKKGLEPKGLQLLKEVSEGVTIPVYALGGIRVDNVEACMKAGAKGICSMANFMCCKDVNNYTKELKRKMR